MTDSHAYSYVHMARQNEACLLAADSVEHTRQFITERSQSGPVELQGFACEGLVVVVVG